MTADQFKAMLLAGNQPAGNFGVNSRYYRIPTSAYTDAQGNTVAYVQRRFITAPAPNPQPQLYAVKQGDRLDNVAAGYTGDPEQFWQIADLNTTMHPEELTTTPGANIRIS
ncbi:LysM domain-containing protein [Deminuibacter soli]|uniref:LysM domain-containing protein n=1 Tax=Deminuibacter soli TaxID=2291815 RepID=A0A3E1NGC5_9BACT|nr:LysM domain-containing protein [Deminuibacter soli]RFM26937.1 LysM domain-containing protein [Deminuibacter soli]